MSGVDDRILATLSQMRFAAAYNAATGSNFTHWDVLELGLLEEASIIAAMELWDM